MRSEKRKRGCREGPRARKKHQYNQMIKNNLRVLDKSKFLKHFQINQTNNLRNDQMQIRRVKQTNIKTNAKVMPFRSSLKTPERKTILLNLFMSATNAPIQIPFEGM